MKIVSKILFATSTSLYLLNSTVVAAFEDEQQDGQMDGVCVRQTRSSVALEALTLPQEERFYFALSCIKGKTGDIFLPQPELDQVAVFLLYSMDVPSAKTNLAWMYLKGRAGLNLSAANRDQKARTLLEEAQTLKARYNLDLMRQQGRL